MARSKGKGGGKPRQRSGRRGSGDGGGDGSAGSGSGSSGSSSGSSPSTTRSRRGGGSRGSEGVRPAAQRRSEKAGTVTKSVQERRSGFRQFLTEVVAELRKVSWPTRPQLLQATAVVLVVLAIATIYLALLDEIFERVVDVIF